VLDSFTESVVEDLDLFTPPPPWEPARVSFFFLVFASPLESEVLCFFFFFFFTTSFPSGMVGVSGVGSLATKKYTAQY